jgi:hypothetical protein
VIAEALDGPIESIIPISSAAWLSFDGQMLFAAIATTTCEMAANFVGSVIAMRAAIVALLRVATTADDAPGKAAAKAACDAVSAGVGLVEMSRAGRRPGGALRCADVVGIGFLMVMPVYRT